MRKPTFYEWFYIEYCKKYYDGDLNNQELSDWLLNRAGFINKNFTFEQEEGCRDTIDFFYHTQDTDFINKETGRNMGNVNGMTGYMILRAEPKLIHQVPQCPLQEDPNVDIFAEWKIKRQQYDRFDILDLEH